MDDSWRFRPIQGNICPTCSISHFPFCYQPPPFNQFPSNPPLNRPVFDPLWDNRGIPRPLSHFDNHGFGMPEPLNRNQSFDNRGLQPNPNFGYGGNGLVPGEFDESDRIHKRMRVGEMSSSPGSGSFVQMPPPFGGYNHGRISSEDERRLSLIRNHGAPSSAMQSHVGMNGYMHESSRSDWQPRFPANAKTTSFPDYRFGSADRMGPMQSMVYEEKKELQRGGHDLGFGHQPQMPRNMQSDVDAAVIGNREESGKEVLFESQKEQSQHPGYGASNYVSPAQHIMDSSVVRQENDHQWGDHPFFPPQEDGHNQHSHVGHQQLLPNNFGQANELQHPQGNNLAVSSNSRIPVGQKHNFHYHDLRNDTRPSFDVKHQPMENINTPVGPHNLPIEEQFGLSRMNQPGAYLHVSTSNNVVPARQSQMMSSQPLVIHPPLPPLPPHPRQFDPPVASPLHLQARSSSPNVSSVYPGPTASSVIMPLNSLPFEGQPFMPKHPSPDKPKVVDASCLFLPPDRATRPDHIVIILRGFPGSGKSYLAKMLRDLEVENGGSAPRIHSMDDYFMTELEKVEEVDNSKSSSMVKGKKRTTKKVMEYCYEPEMEEAYRSSMLKAFKKTLEEGNFTFVIVDDRNLRVADFAQFWASAKRSGYEVYLLEASYKDPVGCAARNVHAFTSDDVHKMAALWEEAPSLYLQLDVQSLFRGDNLKESEIQEVDMDMEDASSGEGSSELSNSNSLKVKEPPAEDCASEGSFKDERWDAEGDDPTRVKELGRSKWSHDEGEEDDERIEGVRGNSNALSGLIQAYSKGEKVHWGDQVGKTGFSIGAAKKAMSLSLIIGPGAGYNLKANPLPEEENVSASEHGRQSKKRSIFEEQLRAERESFRAVFDRRRHRIGGLDTEEE